MISNPDKVEILKPDGGLEIYRNGAIHEREDSVLIIEENTMIRFPKHRVHKVVKFEGDER